MRYFVRVNYVPNIESPMAVADGYYVADCYGAPVKDEGGHVRIFESASEAGQLVTQLEQEERRR